MEQILYIAMSQAFFAGILIATKKPRLMANQVLAAWFFLICIESIILIINSNLVELYSIKVLPFTYGPLMFLYAKLLTTEKPKFQYRFLVHFLPFFVFFIIAMVFLNKPVMNGSKGFLITDRFISLRIIYGISFFISITGYSIATMMLIKKHQKQMKTLVSYASTRVNLRWLIALLATFYLTYVLMFIFGLIDILLNFMSFDPYEISFLGLTIFAFLYGIYGVKQPAIFEEIVYHGNETDEDKLPAEEKKYARSGLKKKDVDGYIEKIRSYMEEEKPYLDRELTINNLSKSTGIPRHFITEILNNHLGMNFYYLINEYRVNEVKARLKNPEYKNLTILAIAYDSGFNSKSSFNSIFKEMTGQTPSQYQKNI